MPVVAVNLTASVFREIAELVDKGQFSSPEEFLATAAFNQLVLERGAKPAVAAISAAQSPAANGASEDPAKGTLVAQVELSARMRRRDAAEGVPTLRSQAALATRMTELFDRLSFSATQYAAMPDFVGPTPDTEPEARIWGQVSRLFPLKLALRSIAVEAARQQEWPNLLDLLCEATAEAALLGTYLEQEDEREGRLRDEQLAIGLPRHASEASEERFKNQVLARVTRTGVHPGATFQFLLTVTYEERIALTPEGLKLAALPNPIIDRLPNAASTLTDEERAVFLSIIRERLPQEYEDTRTVLQAVANQHRTPDALHTNVRPWLPADWTDVVVRTHITGLVSRAVDLGLLKRQWVGRNVKYSLTDAGLAFIG